MILLFGVICPCKKIKVGEGSVHMSFRTRWHTFPPGTTSLLERSSGLQEAYTKVCPNLPKKIPQHVGAMSWDYHVMVKNLAELKQVLV